MAFDQATRNRLQRLVNDARRVLEEEFTRQLQNDYGMDPNAGTVAELASLRHINDAQRETARIVRDTLAHYTASGDMNAAQGLDRIVREQAFTVLNRLAALRMAEARGLLVESVGNGFQAKGFQLYARLAGTGLGETGDAYRVYLFSVFDELAQDLPGLFDRYSPQGRLFPREAALLQVLNLINDTDIAPLWGQDETIGWIYQYFNSKEERKAMREASQAPRNSRELAVRNQFFTPRYVVEFLVDNTLGRLWYEATQGTTTLRDRCQYLLCTPQDVFLRRFDTDDLRPGSVAALVQAGRWSDLPTFDTTEAGVQAMIEFAHCVNTYDRYSNDTWGVYFQRLEPALREQRFADLSTQELWDGIFLICRADRHGGDGSVYQERWFVGTCQEIAQRLKSDEPQRKAAVMAHHPVRDPRTLKLLDPACGSMHFGLYAFDLFAEIYREAWAWEQQHGPGSLQVPADAARTAEYASKTAPALSGKAQEAINREAIKAAPATYAPLCQTYADEIAFLRDVPRLIIEYNIYGVDIDPRAAQIASLALWLRAQRAWHDAGVKAKDRPLVGRGHVVAAIAPPAEPELRQQFAATLDRRDAELFEKTLQLLKTLPELGVLLKVECELPHLIRQVYVGTGTGLFAEQEQESWLKAEARLRVALADFAQAAKSSYQGRLFALDALEGLRLIDLIREQFDVTVMNPPFGAPTENTYEYIRKNYSGFHNDIYASFVARANELSATGFVGCISSRSFLMSPRLEHFRSKVILPRLISLADFGLGVMDDAHVEAAAYVLGPLSDSDFSVVDLRKVLATRESALLTAIASKEASFLRREWFLALPQSKILYAAPARVRELLSSNSYFEPTVGTAREGMKSFDNFRFIRLWWEVAPQRIGRGEVWERFSKGGDFSYFYLDTHLLLNWANEGAELKEINRNLNGSTAQVRQASDYWYTPGVTYSKRSAKGFSARVLPSDTIFTSNGPAVLSTSNFSSLYLLGWINSRIVRGFIHLQSNFGDYSTGSLKRLPWVNPSDKVIAQIERVSKIAIEASLTLRMDTQEICTQFLGPRICDSLASTAKALQDIATEESRSHERAISVASELLSNEYSINDLAWADELLGAPDEADDSDESDADEVSAESCDVSPEMVASSIISYATGCLFGRWDFSEHISRAQTGIAISMPDAFASIPRFAPGQVDVGLDINRISTIASQHPGIVELGGISESSSDTNNRFVERVRHLFDELLDGDSGAWEDDLCTSLRVPRIADYIQKPNGFFSRHLAQYSLSGRQAPIYWPLSSASGDYTVWVYYPKLSSQTIYTAINDFVEPKLKQVGADVTALRNKASARTRDDEKQFEALQAFELELIELRDTLLKLAPTYKPNHDDGVQISAAPLWPLFRHKPWQKLLKDTWAKLEKGDYDWAHLAMNYWPERVREKCRTDKSLAIAHGLEGLYVEFEAAPKKTRGRKKPGAGE